MGSVIAGVREGCCDGPVQEAALNLGPVIWDLEEEDVVSQAPRKS